MTNIELVKTKDRHTKDDRVLMAELTYEQMAELGILALQTTTELVAGYYGYNSHNDLSEVIKSTEEQQRIIALITAALPFTRPGVTLSKDSLELLKYLTATEPQFATSRLQALALSLPVELQAAGIRPGDIEKYETPDDALFAVLPAALGKLK